MIPQMTQSLPLTMWMTLSLPMTQSTFFQQTIFFGGLEMKTGMMDLQIRTQIRLKKSFDFSDFDIEFIGSQHELKI